MNYAEQQTKVPAPLSGMLRGNPSEPPPPSTLISQLQNIRSGMVDLIGNQEATSEHMTGPVPAGATEKGNEPQGVDFLVEQITILMERAISGAVRLRQRIGG